MEDGNLGTGYRPLRVTGPNVKDKTATAQVGGMAAMVNSFEFPLRTQVLINQQIYGEGKWQARETAIFNLIFTFWIVAFNNCYFDTASKSRVAVILNRMHKDISKAKWELKLGTAFSNRRMSRFTDPIQVHPNDVPEKV
eukprot:6177450-Pleurochrysis_carterae.AAC.1